MGMQRWRDGGASRKLAEQCEQGREVYKNVANSTTMPRCSRGARGENF